MVKAQPGVQVPHLASQVLSLALRRPPRDWRRRLGHEPVVVETFVAPQRRGTCYRAASWVHLAQTTGQGRDRQYAARGTVPEVFVYPLVRRWQQALTEDAVGGADPTRATPSSSCRAKEAAA